MKKFTVPTLIPALAAVLFCLGGERKSAEQSDSAPEKTASQPIALEPVIVREQPRGAYAPPYSTPATNTDTPLLEITQLFRLTAPPSGSYFSIDEWIERTEAYPALGSLDALYLPQAGWIPNDTAMSIKHLKRYGMLREPHASSSSAEWKIITDFKSDPFILSHVEGFRKGFSGDCF